MKGTKKMKKFKILMGAVALIVGAATIIACNKEKETNLTQQAMEETGRKLIATFDHSTGRMTCYFDVLELQQKLNEETSTKTIQDRYVIETVQLMDSVPLNQSVLPEVKVTVLDTEEETSYTMWLMRAFTEKEVQQNVTRYYAETSITTGVFEFGFRHEDKYYKVSVNGDDFVTTEIDQLEFSNNLPKIFLWCKRDDCANECTKGGSWWNAYCNPCRDNQGGRCLEDVSPWFVIGSSAVSVVKVIRFLFA
jgi:hypothetical protein